MANLSDLMAALSREPNARGRQFEHVCKWYLQNDPEYLAELQNIWLWDEWPGRWGADCGIDLVAETHDGELWAIQAKAYSPDYHVRKADIDSFLAESSSDAFAFRLLLATTNRIGHNAKRTIDMQTKQVGLRLLADLEAAGLDWPAHPDDMRPRSLARKTPHPYQTEALQNILRGFETHDRGQLLMACGTGKTLVGLWVAEQMNPLRTLILLPSLSLLANTLRTWRENSSDSFICLPVCSDDTVRGQDLATAKTSDLGLPVTTDSSKVAAFLRRPQRLVVFATYQSSSVIAETCVNTDTPPFDLVIADEAHRCAGKVPREFAAILEENKIRAHHRLFMTATPKFFTGKLRCEAQEKELVLASMDDPIHFGPVFHRLSFSEAIDRDLLSDYRVAIVAVDNPTYRRYAQRGEFVTADGIKINDARELASHIATVKAMQQYDLCKLISFHNRVEKAKDFSSRLPEVVAWMPSDDRPSGAVEAAHVSGKMSSGMRDTVLKRFQHANDQQRFLVSNARCLGEGVDVPTLDGVVFIDPRQSQIDIIQALGRAIRKSPEKRYGTIVLPVFIDETKSPKQALESSSFKPIWDVLRALRAHDDVLGETLDRFRHALGRFQKPETDIPEKIHVDIPVSLNEDFSKAMRLKLIESTTASWDYMFGLFERFIEEHGHPYVPARYKTVGGIRLGTWTTAQRVNYRKKCILPEQVRRFEAIEGWEWIPLEKAWKESYGRLLEFVRENGNATIRQDYVSPGGFRLGAWVALQRGVYKKKRLSEPRRALLEKVLGWKWVAERSWSKGFGKLQEYARSNDVALIPRSFKTSDGYELGNWVSGKKQEYKNGTINSEIQQAMESLPGWEWSREKAEWKRGVRWLFEYVQREGHTFVPAQHIEHGFRLGKWVRAQRKEYEKKRLFPEQCRELQAIPHWAWIWKGAENRVAPWDVGLRHLKEFSESEGHTQVPRDYKSPDGFTLGAWLTELRKLHCRGLVKPDQERELYNLPYWGWDIAEMAWHRAYERVVRHIDDRGIDCVSGKTLAPDGFMLGAWVTNQRKKFHDGALTDEQKELLEKLSGWSWELKRRSSGSRSAAWDAAYKKVQVYVTSGGNAAVPRSFVTEDGFKLGEWIGQQRKLFKEGNLQPNQVHLLESLSGWTWDVHGNAWEEGLRRLRHFAENQGVEALDGKTVVEEGFRLGLWVRAQRVAYRKRTLSEERSTALMSIHGWTWQSNSQNAGRRAESWPKWLERLKAYVDEQGTALVPRKYRTATGEGLGLWVGDQRQSYRAEALSLDQIQSLESLPQWSWDPYADAWRVAYGKLQALLEEDGAEAVTINMRDDDGFCLGAWVQSQRRAWKSGRLSEERKKALEALSGWLWESKSGDSRKQSGRPLKIHDRSWKRHQKEVQAYAMEHGHSRVPQRYSAEDGFALGAWVATQRRAFRNGQLSVTRRHMLEGLPGWEWHPHEGVWMRTFSHLRDAFAVLDLPDIDKDYIAGESIHLGLWVRTQQKAYREGKLSTERQKLLDSLPKWHWSAREQPKRRWGDFLNRLKEYHNQNGTISVPLIYKDSDGFPLGSMASQARSSYRKGALKLFRIADLEAINGWSWDVQVPEHYVRVDEAWEHFFSLLQEYVKENGNAMAPTTYRTTTGERLGYWIGGQRKAYRNGSLFQERVQRLEAQQGWLWAPQAFSWDDSYARLKQCVETIEIADIKQAYVCDDGVKTGRWINDQRSDYRRGELPEERIKALEKLPGWVWDQIEAQWDTAFAHLEKYVRETGKIHAPMAYKVDGDGFCLGQWLRNQRKAHNNGKLSIRRTRLIEQLTGWQW